jgi:hypothetical protein
LLFYFYLNLFSFGYEMTLLCILIIIILGMRFLIGFIGIICYLVVLLGLDLITKVHNYLCMSLSLVMRRVPCFLLLLFSVWI